MSSITYTHVAWLWALARNGRERGRAREMPYVLVGVEVNVGSGRVFARLPLIFALM